MTAGQAEARRSVQKHWKRASVHFLLAYEDAVFDPVANYLPSSASSAILGRLYQETPMQTTPSTNRIRLAAAWMAAGPFGLEFGGAAGAIRSVPVLAGRLLR